jgi:hypothetical protein
MTFERALRFFLCLLAATIVNVAMAADPLHHQEVNIKNPGGKDLLMKFDELRRDEKTSTAKVTRISGASVASSMFIVQGFYDIANLRGAAYFVKLKEWRADDGNVMYLVGFANDDKKPIPELFNLSESDGKSADTKFFSVKDYDQIFKPGK